MANEIITNNIGRVVALHRGTWSASTAYSQLDIVYYQGGSYMAVATTVPAGTLPTDTTYWRPMAAKGDKGDTGDTGPKGEKGDTGTFDSVTAEVDANTGTPSVDVDYTSPGIVKFKFHNIKGEKGNKGDTGEKGSTGDVGSFIATYGTTTASEIATAITAGKAVFCNYTDGGVTHQLMLIDITDGKYGFAESTVGTNSGVTSVSGIVASLARDTNTWSVSTGNGSIPTKTSELTNDSGYLTEHQSLSAYRTATAQDSVTPTTVYETAIPSAERSVITQALFYSLLGGFAINNGKLCIIEEA